MNDPDLESDSELLAGLAEGFAERYRRGERPAVSEYARRYPELADRIRDLFPALVAMEEFGSVEDRAAGGTAARRSHGDIPRRLGEYRILREVGRGGMGVVYEAVQESLGRHVALKVLPSAGLTGSSLERFSLEARVAARLHHTNIVPVFGVGQDGSICYYAMQFIRGQGLDDVIAELRRRRDREPRSPGEAAGPTTAGRLAEALTRGFDAVPSGSLPDDAPPAPVVSTEAGDDATSPASEPGTAGPPGRRSELSLAPSEAHYHRGIARVGLQVAEALAYAHGHGILHRDIKPANLLLDEQATAWVTDFGLAKAEGSDGPTQTGEIVGTLRYMAPERFEGRSDPRSDIYGLGATLYELLTLRPPFHDTDRARLIDRVLRGVPERPRKLNPRIPRDLETIALKALAKEPAHRYATAEQMAEDLRRFQADRPILARRTTRSEQAWRWCRRNPAFAGLLTTIVALLAVTVAVLAVGNARIRGALKQEKLARADLVRTLYYQWIAAAAHERAKNRNAHAEELLDLCPPGLRGWEWHYLRRLPFTEVLKLPHGDIINRVAWSPDGRWLASGSRKGWVKVWDARTGAELLHLQAQKGFVRGLAFSPDGRLLATGGEDDRVNVWDVGTGRLLRELPTGAGITMLQALEFSPDGRLLAAADQGRNVRLWDLADGREVRLPEEMIVTGGLAFTSDGRHLITVGAEGVVKVLDVTDRRVIAAFRTDTRAVGYGVAFSRDRRLLALGCEDGSVTLIRTDPLEVVRTLEAHAGEISGLAFGAGDARLASAGDDLAVKIWDSESGQEVFALEIVVRRANGLAFSPDGHRLAVGSADGAVQILDGTPLEGPGGGGQLLTLGGHGHAVVGLVYSPDGGQIASASWDGTARVWDARTGRGMVTFRGHRAALTGVAWAPDGRRLASASWDGTARVWDPATGAEIIPALDAAAGPVYGLAFSRDGRALATAHHDGSVRVWDAATGRAGVGLPYAHTQPVLGVAFSPGGEHLASAGGKDNTIKIWDWRADTGRPVRTLVAPGGIIRSPAYSPDGRRLVAVVGTPARLWTWDLATGEGEERALPDTWKVSQAVFRPGGGPAIVSSGRVQVLDADTADGMDLVGGHAGEIRCAAFSPDGRYLATGSGYKGRGEVRIWDVARREGTP